MSETYAYFLKFFMGVAGVLLMLWGILGLIVMALNMVLPKFHLPLLTTLDGACILLAFVFVSFLDGVAFRLGKGSSKEKVNAKEKD